MIARCPMLFSPVGFLGLQLKNRLVVGPMTRTNATDDGRATQIMADYYAQYASGGFAMVIAEATYIDEEYSQGWWNQPGIANAAQRDAWRPLAEAVHKAGAGIILQLYHGGALNQGNRYTKLSIGPSAVRPPGKMAEHHGGSGLFPVPRAMEKEDMRKVSNSFALAARHAIDAGFDGVEVHGANGYLLDQFLTTETNLRTDEYGGPVANRVRFLREVLQAVRAAVPADKVVGIRLSPSKSTNIDYTWPGGAEEAREIFSTLGGVGNVYLHVSANLGIAEPIFGVADNLPSMARRFSGMPVIACGMLEDPERAERLLAASQTDLVALSRAALADPDWPNRIQRGESPLPFDYGALEPNSKIETALAWRVRKRAQMDGKR
jgi:2,4-dienoyl-CoA reductase-like NADH-dependent reductase (Old Yellow Enzyme family)